MSELFQHQRNGIPFLLEREGAGIFWEQGTGKTRTAIMSAQCLYQLPANAKRRIDAVLVLCPAAVTYAWREELRKLASESSSFNANLLRYDSKSQTFKCEEVIGVLNGNPHSHMPVAVVSYALLQQKRHVVAIGKRCFEHRVALICDESSFLKNRTAAQTKGAKYVAESCSYRWLLSGTPICNSPLDLWAQAEVMYPEARGSGPLHGFANFYHFKAQYCDMVLRRMGQKKFNEVVGYKNLDQLQSRFARYVSRVEKRDCLDLPAKSYTVREVKLDETTWRVYQELRREAMLCLPDTEAKPEPNAAVRILRLCQLTSGHVGGAAQEFAAIQDEQRAAHAEDEKFQYSVDKDVSSEKLDYLVAEIVSGELANERALIVWCRWRRERERLAHMLAVKNIPVPEIYGGQQQKQREAHLEFFQDVKSPHRRVLLAQQHAGGFGLNLTAAHTAVYLSNDWSYSTRVQSEDRTHRIGQNNPCLYIDVVAVGPKGQRTVDHAILDALRAKKSLAETTCAGWRRVLEE